MAGPDPPVRKVEEARKVALRLREILAATTNEPLPEEKTIKD